MEPHGKSPWYLHVLRGNPPKHTLLRARLRRVILLAVIVRRHRLWPTASMAIGRGLLRRRIKVYRKIEI
jgi:hypothetical protein